MKILFNKIIGALAITLTAFFLTQAYAQSRGADLLNLDNARPELTAAYPPTYKITVPVNTPDELYLLIAQLKTSNNPLLIEAVPNLISE